LPVSGGAPLSPGDDRIATGFAEGGRGPVTTPRTLTLRSEGGGRPARRKFPGVRFRG